MPGSREPFVPLTLVALAPALLWVLHFAFVYLLEGFLCSPVRPAAMAIPAAIIIATLLGAGLCAWIFAAGTSWLRCSGSTRLQAHLFLCTFQRLLAGLALVAIVWGGTGALLLAPCAFIY